MKLIRIIIACCIILSLALFIGHTDPDEVVSAIQQIGYKFILLIVITAFAYLLATLSWKYAMGNEYKTVSIPRLFMIRHVGETLSLLNPASIIGGEAFKVHLLRDYGMKEKTIISSVLMSRLIMIMTQMLLFTAALTVLLAKKDYSYSPAQIVVPSPYLIVALILTLVLLYIFRNSISRHLSSTKQGAYLKIKYHLLYLKFAQIILELKTVLKSNKLMIGISFLLAALHWITGATEFYFILKFLGIKVSLMNALMIDMGVIIFKTAGAFIPGQLGIEEYGNKIMLAAIGIPGTEIWITASILRRARQCCWILAGGLIYLYLFRKKETSLNGNPVHQP